MSHIETTEGPIIGLDRELLKLWGGSDSLSFFSSTDPNKTDYDVLCKVLLPNEKDPLDGKVVDGRFGIVICLGYPFSTHLITVLPGLYMFVQVEFANEDWDICEVSMKDFDEAQIKVGEIGKFSSRAESILFFDASLMGADVGSECIEMTFEPGSYSLMLSYNGDHRRGIYIYIAKKLVL